MAKIVSDRDNGDGTYTQFFDDGSARQFRFGTNQLISSGSAELFPGGFKQTAAKPTAANNYGADTSAEDKQIAILEKMFAESSGFKREELAQKIRDAQADRANRIETARIAANASKYSADRSLEGTKYSSDNSAASSRYGTDADLYKFNAMMPLERADRANTFLKTYEDMASRPDSFLQASNYARLGYQVEGMPAMLNDLLGQVNPNARPVGTAAAVNPWTGQANPYSTSAVTAPVGGNIAFRTGTGAMPLTAADAVFGQNPLALVDTRAATPALPAWNGPSQASFGTPVGAQYQAGQYGSPALMSGVFAQSLPQQQPIPAGKAYDGLTPPGAQTFAPQTMIESQFPQYGAQRGAQTYAQPTTRGQATGPMASLTSQGTIPRILTGQGVAPDPTQENLFQGGVRTLMQRGAHQWGNQALERMTKTERDLLASGIKANGGVPGDYEEAYARSRIGNDAASGRSL